MKAGFLFCVLLLAGSAASSPVQYECKSLEECQIPDWVEELIQDVIAGGSGALDALIERLPEILDTIPELLERLPEIVERIVDELPSLIPEILERIGEIIRQIPEIVQRLPECVRIIVNKLPDVMPIVVERLNKVIAAFPDVYEKVREYIISLGIDWIPDPPAFEESWIPEGFALPEYNTPVPGVQTSVEENPGIVQIELGTGSAWFQDCTGSILTSVHVVSSARCFSLARENSRYRRVRAGSSNRNAGGTVVTISSALNHPDFGQNTFDCDISIVRLGTGFTFSSVIQQTPIVSQGFEIPAGLGVELYSWGSTAEGLPYADNNLYKTDLTLIDQSSCIASWARIPLLPVTDNMLCVGKSETNGRNGDLRDMGAPIYYDGVLVGMSSFSVSWIGNQNFPVVATKISAFTSWIVANAT